MLRPCIKWIKTTLQNQIKPVPARHQQQHHHQQHHHQHHHHQQQQRQQRQQQRLARIAARARAAVGADLRPANLGSVTSRS